MENGEALGQAAKNLAHWCDATFFTSVRAHSGPVITQAFGCADVGGSVGRRSVTHGLPPDRHHQEQITGRGRGGARLVVIGSIQDSPKRGSCRSLPRRCCCGRRQVESGVMNLHV